MRKTGSKHFDPASARGYDLQVMFPPVDFTHYNSAYDTDFSDSALRESRILQVSIFNTLQNNLANVDFDSVLLDVMTIADEVDSQLKQAVLGFTESAVTKAMLVTS